MFRAESNRIAEENSSVTLFAAIGRFLDEHRLSPEPAHYHFAHRILTDPDGPLARVMARLTDGGVRLTPADIAELAAAPGPGAEESDDTRDQVADRTEHQLRDFAGLMARMRTETSDFGRDLAATVDGLRSGDGNQTAHLTAAMLDRIRTAETRLAQATSEADALREQLEVARGDARSDTLTGLPNRRALLEEFAERSVGGEPLCLAICDIDHFKRINDRFGHPIGDRVLRAVGNALAEACKGAFVARHGGEEFALLFPTRSLADAATTLDRARAEVAAKRYKVRDDGTPLGAVTFSAGLVAVAPGETFEPAFDRADLLLYSAKGAGRNQVCAQSR